MPTLTPRMKDILDEMAKGKSTAEIGTTLGICPSTIRVYKCQIKNMAGVRTDIGLMNWLVKNVDQVFPITQSDHEQVPTRTVSKSRKTTATKSRSKNRW